MGAMRILLAGDTHGNRGHVKYLFDQAVRFSCDRIVQLGDFGYWPHANDFDEYVARLSKQSEIPFYWLDGNHENFDILEREADMDSARPVQMENGLWYLPRGCTWEWEGVRYMAFGGAYSIDKEWRMEGVSWWPQELPTVAQQSRALDRGSVDILLTHDAPDGICPIITPGYKGDEISSVNRRWISALVDAVQPKILVHGHMHHRYSAQIPDGPQVEGLDCDDSGGKSFVILDSERIRRVGKETVTH